ncbi:metal ABC transporter ATP-binding protein [Pseudomonas sp.]|uniref:metal ABC transporter ATP-binding protein n=1 Tax=Pseudomonas sp. TaxID=306 RepID=UPI00272F6E42|nr:ATP-binding cassette domain-containing protein [Pseudomonas sp.]MDP2242528.1 ATP-binding cassette domain-containing protein [Pseudomonas sp.]
MIHCQHLQWGPAGQPLTPPLDLLLPSGSLTGLIGSNGCGKSSLLKVIAGLQQPLRGRVELSVPRLGGVAYLVQQQALDRQFPISLQSLVSTGFWRSPLNRRQRQARLAQVLDDWGLHGLQQQSLQALSGGELQRALLARLSLTDARVLLLDEPEAALDDHGQILLWQHIQRWQAEGRTQLLVSHDLSSLSQRLENALQLSRSACLYGPIRQLIGQRPSLEQVA